MASGGDIEKRGLSAIGISHQGDLYHLAALFGQCSHLSFKPGLATGLQCRQGLTSRQEFLCFSLTDNLNLGRFLATKRYLISYDFILDRIPERGIEDDFHLAALHESHFYYPFTKASVTIDLNDHATLPRPEFRKFHILVFAVNANISLFLPYARQISILIATNPYICRLIFKKE